MQSGVNDKEEFVDYYELMQISPNAEAETVQRVYRMLAARYHPDNPETGDAERFLLLNEAFRTLSEPEHRAAYDLTYHSRRAEPLRVFELKEFASGIDGEANRRMGILCLLYSRRRTDPDHPGMSILELETMMWFPREHLVFTVWYLKEKGYIRQDDQSNLMMTAEGADYVESNLPANRTLYKLLKASELGATRSERDAKWHPGDPVSPHSSSE
ncbi:MAG: DnaJ domain-containing protein [Bryobacteraceae bacterium]